MSPTIISVFVQFAVIFLPMLGVQVGSDQLTVAIQTIVVVASGFVIWYRRVAHGGVNVLGVTK